MAYELLVSRIEARIRFFGISEREALRRAKVGEKTVYHLKLGHAPKPATLKKLARGLHVPPRYFLDAAADNDDEDSIALRTVFVRGFVQAGVWREAIEWDGDDWYAIEPPSNRRRFPGVERFGLEVRGTSMNALYPEGSVVIVVRFGDIGRGPHSGERIVVLTRSDTGAGYEATLKEYQIDDRGRHILWPRSTDPDFQTPIILKRPDLPVSQGYEPFPRNISAGDLAHAAGEPDLMAAALVVGLYKEEY